MFNLIVVVRDPVSGDARELRRAFDPATLPGVLQTKWGALGPAVLAMITDLNVAVAADPSVPALL